VIKLRSNHIYAFLYKVWMNDWYPLKVHISRYVDLCSFCAFYLRLRKQLSRSHPGQRISLYRILRIALQSTKT
jgi:hypothetical protein